MEVTGGLGTEGEGATAVRPRANVFGHDALSGTYRTRLEANGRVVLPSALRLPFTTSGTAHLLPRPHAIWLQTPQSFEVMVDDIVAKQADGMLATETRSLLFKAAPKVGVDKQARLVIPPEQREALGLSGEAELVLTGAIERVEIWPASWYDQHEAPKLADLDLLLAGHGGLPTGTA